MGFVHGSTKGCLVVAREHLPSAHSWPVQQPTWSSGFLLEWLLLSFTHIYEAPNSHTNSAGFVIIPALQTWKVGMRG